MENSTYKKKLSNEDSKSKNENENQSYRPSYFHNTRGQQSISPHRKPREMERNSNTKSNLEENKKSSNIRSPSPTRTVKIFGDDAAIYDLNSFSILKPSIWSCTEEDFKKLALSCNRTNIRTRMSPSISSDSEIDEFELPDFSTFCQGLSPEHSEMLNEKLVENIPIEIKKIEETPKTVKLCGDDAAIDDNFERKSWIWPWNRKNMPKQLLSYGTGFNNRINTHMSPSNSTNLELPDSSTLCQGLSPKHSEMLNEKLVENIPIELKKIEETPKTSFYSSLEPYQSKSNIIDRTFKNNAEPTNNSNNDVLGLNNWFQEKLQLKEPNSDNLLVNKNLNSYNLESCGNNSRNPVTIDSASITDEPRIEKEDWTLNPELPKKGDRREYSNDKALLTESDMESKADSNTKNELINLEENYLVNLNKTKVEYIKSIPKVTADRFYCKIFSKSYKNKKMMHRHEEEHDLVLRCQYCKKVFALQRTLNYHLKKCPKMPTAVRK